MWIAWGGPPLNERAPRNRMHFVLAASGDLDAEVDRLVALGAAVLARTGDEARLTDPDGNELVLRAG